MSAAVQKCTEFGSILANTSWTTEDAMAMMAGRPAAEENKGESKRVHAECFSRRCKTTPAIRRKCRAFLIQGGVA